jgi:hypothetical protein
VASARHIGLSQNELTAAEEVGLRHLQEIIDA